jgi:polyhydroxyalkanoate synthesis regulator phasin
MNKLQFIDTLSKSMSDPSITKTDMDDAWDTYQDLIEQINESEEDSASKQMNRLTEMDASERLIWRTCLAECGIELTPLQVNDYLKIVELAISNAQ